MPRAFLVKKPCVSTCKRNWSELPDEERGEIYVPGETPARGGPRVPAALRPAAASRRRTCRTQRCEARGRRSSGARFNV